MTTPNAPSFSSDEPTFKPRAISSFKAYDIRGELGVSLDEDIAYRIGRAFAQILAARFDDNNRDAKDEVNKNLNRSIVIGCDIRSSSEALKSAAISGILDAGIDVIDLGMTGTEEVYFATSHYQALGGIEVTASHNPINYNGLKLVKEGSRPISADDGLADIQALAESGNFAKTTTLGNVQLKTDKSAYIEHLLTFIDVKNIKPLTLVINCGNGSAAPVVDLLLENLLNHGAPLDIVRLHHEPDGSFPNGIPNPMILENRVATRDAVIDNSADLGIAFDGDFDRCFLFDETGNFIDGSYVVGMLAQAFLQKHPNEAIVYDPRVIFNTEAVIEKFAGKGVVSKSGHSFIKQTMRDAGAIYGGEMSAHHYFRDFFYCDSGMIPWLLSIELLSTSGKTLSELVCQYIAEFPSSGELNFRLTTTDAPTIINDIEQHFATQTPTKSMLDGLSLDFDAWRFNLRASNTEPLIRLNIEAKGDHNLLEQKTGELTTWLENRGAKPA